MSSYSFIDSHAHLTYKTKDVHGMIQRAKNAHIDIIINVCTDFKSLKEGENLSRQYDFIYNIGATTPHDVEKEGKTLFPIFSSYAKEKKIIGIGETGLDYHYKYATKEIQQLFLKKYMHLAKETSLPIVFHCREAFSDLFKIADENYKNKPALLHCFTGSIEEAKKSLDRGWLLSFSGIITYKNAQDLRKVIEYVPLDHISIETDTPYLTPQKYRGKLNEPAFVVEVASCIADIKKSSLENLTKQINQNIHSFFSIK